MATKKEGRQRQRRTDEEKKDILNRVAVGEEIGESRVESCKAVGVPRTTVNSWLDQTTLDEVRNGTTGEGYRHLKARMLEEFAGTSKLGLDSVRDFFEAASKEGVSNADKALLAKAAKDAAIAVGIAADKVMLLTGQPTTRSERVNTNNGVDTAMFEEAMKALGLRLSGRSPVIDAEYTVVDECDKRRA